MSRSEWLGDGRRPPVPVTSDNPLHRSHTFGSTTPGTSRKFLYGRTLAAMFSQSNQPSSDLETKRRNDVIELGFRVRKVVTFLRSRLHMHIPTQGRKTAHFLWLLLLVSLVVCMEMNDTAENYTIIRNSMACRVAVRSRDHGPSTTR